MIKSSKVIKATIFILPLLNQSDDAQSISTTHYYKLLLLLLLLLRIARIMSMIMQQQEHTELQRRISVSRFALRNTFCWIVFSVRIVSVWERSVCAWMKERKKDRECVCAYVLYFFLSFFHTHTERIRAKMKTSTLFNFEMR